MVKKKKRILRGKRHIYKPVKGFKRNYKDPVYKQWRRDVKIRDGFTCKMPRCGCKQRGKLEVHHILKWVDYPALRFNVINGITLCRKCHEMVNGNEHNYVTLFQSIVRNHKND